jgi:hypothetical protein
MPSDKEFSDEKIEKMLEEARMKPVPPQVLKGFKDDVMRRIEAERGGQSKPAGPKPGSWFAGGFRLPRVQMTVGAGAFACLILVSIVALTVDHPAPVAPVSKEAREARAVVSVPGISDGAFQVASVPAAMTASSQAVSVGAAASVRTSDMMKAASQTQGPSQAGPAAGRRTSLTVEEELRLIEEFDDRRFFIRQDITEDELASA